MMLNAGQKLGNEGNEKVEKKVHTLVAVNHVSYAATIWVNTVPPPFFLNLKGEIREAIIGLGTTSQIRKKRYKVQ